MQNSAANISIKSTLINRNVIIHGRRTSVRLEPEMWSALFDITAREDRNIHQLCSAVHDRKKPETSLTAAIRVFVMAYFRSAATEDGHKGAGRGVTGTGIESWGRFNQSNENRLTA